MIISVVAILMAIALTTMIVRRESGQLAQLRSGRAPLMKIGVQIICGDCSGDQDKPKRTCLDIHGRCDECGGTSYVLASNFAMTTSTYQEESYMRAAADHSTGRILPFHPASSRRSVPGTLAGDGGTAKYDEGQSAIAAG